MSNGRTLLLVAFQLALLGCSNREGPAVTLAVTPASTGGPFYTDMDIEITGNLADDKADLGELDVSLTSSIDGALDWDISVSIDGDVDATGMLTPGEHTLTLAAIDDKDNAGSATAEAVVRPPNSPPTCMITQPTDDAVLAPGSFVDFYANVADVDIGDDLLTVSWASNPDGDLGTATVADGEAYLSSTLSTGPHILAVTTTDELGAACLDTVRVLVAQAPEITFVTPDPNAFVNDGEVLALSVLVNDDFDAAPDVQVLFESDLDGDLGSAVPDEQGDAGLELSTLSVGEHVISATAIDSHGLAAVATTGATVNGLPTAPAWQCFVTANDGDDDGAEAESDAIAILTGTVVYDIVRSDLVNQNMACTTAYRHVYDADAKWGFSWTDTSGIDPAKVTVQVNLGVNCSSLDMVEWPTALNGKSAGTFPVTKADCICPPSPDVHSWVLSDLAGYDSSGTNTFLIATFEGVADGLSENVGWGKGVFARVTVEY